MGQIYYWRNTTIFIISGYHYSLLYYWRSKPISGAAPSASVGSFNLLHPTSHFLFTSSSHTKMQVNHYQNGIKCITLQFGYNCRLAGEPEPLPNKATFVTNGLKRKGVIYGEGEALQLLHIFFQTSSFRELN